MTEYEEHKMFLTDQLANLSFSNAEVVVKGIEVMIDLRIVELLDQVKKDK